MKLRFAIALSLVLVAALPGAILASTKHSSVDMKALNGSGQTGTATITRVYKGKQTVTISLDNEPAGASEPAHIHPGSCSKVSPVPKVVLSNVVGGKSVTSIPALATENGNWSIVVHKGSGADMKVYVACGDIPSP